jgi:hypothetical protein
LDESGSAQAATPQVSELPSAERDLLKLMLEHGNEMVGFVFSHVEKESFTHPMAQCLVQVLLQHADSGATWDAHTLVDEIDEEEQRRFIADLMFSKYEISKGWQQMGSVPEEPDPGEVAERCFVIIRRQQLDTLLKENQQRMKEAGIRGEPTREYLERHNALLTEKKDLEKNTGKNVLL